MNKEIEEFKLFMLEAKKNPMLVDPSTLIGHMAACLLELDDRLSKLEKEPSN